MNTEYHSRGDFSRESPKVVCHLLFRTANTANMKETTLHSFNWDLPLQDTILGLTPLHMMVEPQLVGPLKGVSCRHGGYFGVSVVGQNGPSL